MREIDATISLNEFAEITGHSRQTIYNKIYRQELKATRLEKGYTFRYYDALKYKYENKDNYPLTVEDIYLMTSVIRDSELTIDDKFLRINKMIQHQIRLKRHIDDELIKVYFDLLFKFCYTLDVFKIDMYSELYDVLETICNKYNLNLDSDNNSYLISVMRDIYFNNIKGVRVLKKEKHLMFDALVEDIEADELGLRVDNYNSQIVLNDLLRYVQYVIYIHLPLSFDKIMQ